MNKLKHFRKAKDEYFASGSQSPLTDEQKRDFTGLSYFPENRALRFDANVDEIRPKEEVALQTNTGAAQRHLRWGRVHFTVEGKPAELTIYETDGKYFLPFVDSLAGKETYGAGRYLEPRRRHDGTFHIDFNYAYNPFCAYNERWSCPIPPAGNRLEVPIRAGEKIFE